MSNIIRVEHSRDYTCIANAAIRDKRLSLKARGLHHLLLSYPNNWRISVEHLSEEASDKDARTAIQSAIKELEKLGYLTREQSRDEKGRIAGWESVIRELPQAGFPTMDKSADGKSNNRKTRRRENPQMENPTTENQPLISTDLKEVSKKEIPTSPNPASGENVEEGERKKRSREDGTSPRQLGTNPRSLGTNPRAREEISTELILPDQTSQPITSKDSHPIREIKDSAIPCDNSAFIGHGNFAPDGKQRPFDQLTAKWRSIPSDPWMQGINPSPEFKRWVYQKALAEGKPYRESKAAGEIRNNFQRAADLWEEYQSELHRYSSPPIPAVEDTTETPAPQQFVKRDRRHVESFKQSLLDKQNVRKA